MAIHSLSEATELQAEHLGLVWEEDEAPWAAKHMPLAMFVLHEKSGGAQCMARAGCALLVSQNKRWGSLERK